jgi:hypothetical protein
VTITATGVALLKHGIWRAAQALGDADAPPHNFELYGPIIDRVPERVPSPSNRLSAANGHFSFKTKEGP